MKQEDLAPLVGTSRETLGKWERGRTSPTAAELIKLGRYTRTDPGYFLAGLAGDASEAGVIGPGLAKCAPWDLNPEPADYGFEHQLHLFPMVA